jgi:hypothetical protein
MFTNSNIPIAIEKHGPVYDVSIGDPPVKRQFLGGNSLVEYIATRFTMSVKEALGLMRQMEIRDGRCSVTSLPILPENIASL